VTSSLAPPAAVSSAFGVREEPRPLAVPTWVAGDVVLKPESDPELHSWLGTSVAPVERRGYRLADPIPAADGSWVVAGWSATRWVSGESVPASGPSVEKWARALEAGRAFHRSVSGLARPGFLERRDSWWARADRRAWDEAGAAEPVPELAPTARLLRAACRPLGRAQVVHGDLSGNVLLDGDLDPAVIDVSPYWRPPAYGEGVLVADALCWHGADPTLLDQLEVSVPAVARAMLFRLWTTHERVSAGVRVADLADEACAYADAAEAIGLG
jgi:hypothetical protein